MWRECETLSCKFKKKLAENIQVGDAEEPLVSIVFIIANMLDIDSHNMQP